jgi:Tfp pilus assembly protein PilE
MRHQRGLSLVELLFAFAILTLVILTSFAAFVERTRRQQQASEIILAHQALANEAEYRRRMTYSSLDSQPTEFVSDLSVLEPLQPYAAIVSVKQLQPGVKTVMLTIRWRDGVREARLELLRADTGGGNLW